MCYVNSECAPPLILCSWHAPSISAGQESFEQSVDRLQEEITQMRGKPAHATRLVVCGDFNCQLVESLPLVGQSGCAVERSADSARACYLHGVLEPNDLKVHSSFHNLGPTRKPWPHEAEKGDQPIVIDFACASSKLQSCVFVPEDFPQVTRSDHFPIAIHLLAPKTDQRRRRKLMEALLRKPSAHIPARWEPRNREEFRRDIHQITPESLQQVGSNFLVVWWKPPGDIHSMRAKRTRCDRSC